jgi:hypothetical protein
MLLGLGEMILNTSDEKHPADEIGKALSRAGGILSSLTNCIDKSEIDFEISVPFVFEAVSAAEKLVSKANEELARLYEFYDLSKVETPVSLPNLIPIQEAETAVGEAETAADVEVPEFSNDYSVPNLAAEQTVESNGSLFGAFRPTDQVHRLATRLDSILETIPNKSRKPAPLDLADRPADTYNELFDKLTAMADAAAYQAHQSPGQSETLLPLLERLRADMIRIRNVA